MTAKDTKEREQALTAGLGMLDQIDPSYMSAVMQSLMSVDPDSLKAMMAKQTQALFSMSDDDRRAMMKLNMRAP